MQLYNLTIINHISFKPLNSDLAIPVLTLGQWWISTVSTTISGTNSQWSCHAREAVSIPSPQNSVLTRRTTVGK